MEEYEPVRFGRRGEVLIGNDALMLRGGHSIVPVDGDGGTDTGGVCHQSVVELSG